MTRPGLAAVVIGLGVALLAPAMPHAARAEPAPAVAPGAAPTDISAQSRRTVRRAPRRVPIYRGSPHGPGPNAVRICNAYYEQEYRPSGTVIVPRMHCYWRG